MHSAPSEDAFRRSDRKDFGGGCKPAARRGPVSTHIAAAGYVFYIIFGAASGLHFAKVQLLLKNLDLES